MNPTFSASSQRWRSVASPRPRPQCHPRTKQLRPREATKNDLNGRLRQRLQHAGAFLCRGQGPGRRSGVHHLRRGRYNEVEMKEAARTTRIATGRRKTTEVAFESLLKPLQFRCTENGAFKSLILKA